MIIGKNMTPFHLSQDEKKFAVESIREILNFAEIGITQTKDNENNCVYGLATTLLICCAFDAMGRLGLNNDGKLKKTNTGLEYPSNRNRFKYIDKKYIKTGNYGILNNLFEKVLYNVYRNGLVHSATLQKNNWIKKSNTQQPPIVENRIENTIYLEPLLDMAKDVFERLCKDCNLSIPTEKNYLHTSATGYGITNKTKII